MSLVARDNVRVEFAPYVGVGFCWANAVVVVWPRDRRDRFWRLTGGCGWGSAGAASIVRLRLGFRYLVSSPGGITVRRGRCADDGKIYSRSSKVCSGHLSKQKINKLPHQLLKL